MVPSSSQRGMALKQLCSLLLLVTTLTVVASEAIPAACDRGCPHTVNLCCGEDGHTYQSACLAICQGIRIVHHQPCEGSTTQGRNPSALQLSKLLQAGPEQPSAASNRRSLGAQDSQQHRRQLTHQSMTQFSGEGFRLVGLIELKDGPLPNDSHPKGMPIPDANLDTDSADASEAEKYASLDQTGDHAEESPRVRALRVTSSGLLYAATYDLDSLTESLRATKRRGSVQQRSKESKTSHTSCSPADGSDDQDVSISGPQDMPDQPSYNPFSSDREPVLKARMARRRLSQTSSTDKGQPQNRLQEPYLPNPRPDPIPEGSRMPSPPGSSRPAAPVTPPPPFPPGTMNVCNSTQFPFTAIGQLQLTDSAGTYVCTGTLVSRDAVLTAAHCVFRRDNQGGGNFFKQLDFAAGRYRLGNRIVNPYNVTSWAFATIFDTYQIVPQTYQFDWDVAIIRITAPVGRAAGWLGMAAGCAMNTATGRLATSYMVGTAGYASALPFGMCTTSVCSVVKDDCSGRTAYHTCPSMSGQSGSPLYVGKDFRVRGVLVGTVSADSSPMRVVHIVGSKSYTAVLKWISEPMPTATQEDDDKDSITVAANDTANVSPSPRKSMQEDDGPGKNATTMDGALNDSTDLTSDDAMPPPGVYPSVYPAVYPCVVYPCLGAAYPGTYPGVYGGYGGYGSYGDSSAPVVSSRKKRQGAKKEVRKESKKEVKGAKGAKQKHG